MPLIAHLSDLHLLCLHRFNPLDLVGKRITGAINLLLNRGGQFPVQVARAVVQDINLQSPDHVVVSGDLSNLSLVPELELARQVLEGLDLPRSRVTVVPGNHDCYTRGAQRQEVFDRVMHPFLEGDLQPGPGHFPLLRLQEGLALLALSTARASAPLMAVGTLGRRQIRLAMELLSDEACRGRFRVVVLHHPPGGPHVHWHNTLTDHEALRRALHRVGAELLLHGHIHRFSQETLPGPDGPIPVVGTASATWLSPGDARRRAQYNLYHVQHGRLAGITIRRYDPKTGVTTSQRVCEEAFSVAGAR